MIIEGRGRIIEVIQKPYELNGNKGVSYRVRALIDDEIFVLKSTESQTNDYKQYEGEEGHFKLKLSSPRESVRVDLVEFERM